MGPHLRVLTISVPNLMKITHVICQILRAGSVTAKTASCQDAVLVRVRTDTGLEGIGEADSSPEVVKAIIDAPFSHNIACGLRQLLLGAVLDAFLDGDDLVQLGHDGGARVLVRIFGFP